MPSWRLWLTRQTINLMTLGGLALAIGILVDEATVEIENIHAQMRHTPIDRPGRAAGQRCRPPCRGCWPCCAFWPCSCRRSSCKGRRGLFVPLSLAVGFSMIASYILSSTFVPVVSTWLLRHVSHTDAAFHEAGWFEQIRRRYHSLVERALILRVPIVFGYLAVKHCGHLVDRQSLGHGNLSHDGGRSVSFAVACARWHAFRKNGANCPGGA